jgi:hypothetical protein
MKYCFIVIISFCFFSCLKNKQNEIAKCSLIVEREYKQFNKGSYLSSETIYDGDSNLLRETFFRAKNEIFVEFIYSKVKDSLSYGMVIFYDTFSGNKVKYVELIPIVKSINKHKVRRFTQNYLRENYKTEYENWLKKTNVKKAFYPVNINTY